MKNTSLANSTIVKWVSQKVSTTAAIVSGSVLSDTNFIIDTNLAKLYINFI